MQVKKCSAQPDSGNQSLLKLLLFPIDIISLLLFNYRSLWERNVFFIAQFEKLNKLRSCGKFVLSNNVATVSWSTHFFANRILFSFPFQLMAIIWMPPGLFLIFGTIAYFLSFFCSSHGSLRFVIFHFLARIFFLRRTNIEEKMNQVIAAFFSISRKSWFLFHVVRMKQRKNYETFSLLSIRKLIALQYTDRFAVRDTFFIVLSWRRTWTT